jgi:hypothetical protein
MSELLGGAIGETSSGQHVLMKDQSRIKKAVRQTTIVVNSRDRNYLAYPNPNHFRYTLRRPLTNVISIELVNAVIPSTLFTIQLPWASFTFREGSTDFTVTLTPGYYNEFSLACELETQLNALTGITNTYKVIFIQHNVMLNIVTTNTNPASYTLKFFSGDFRDEIDMNNLAILSINTPARLLGFGLNDYTSDVNGVIMAPLAMDVENFFNKLYLHLEADGKNLARMEMGAGRQDCFHIFFFHPGEYQYTFLNRDTIQSVFTSSPAPLARIANLEVNLRDEFNRPAFLNFREIQLIFEITHLE